MLDILIGAAAAASVAQVETRAASSLAMTANAAISIDTPLQIDLELFSDPNGKVISCTGLVIEGAVAIKDAICKVAIKQKIKPATNSAGENTHGLALLSVRNGQGHGANLSPTVRPADLVINIGKYPTGFSQPLRVGLVIDILPDGRIASCQGQSGHIELAKLACSQVVTLKRPIRSGANQVPVSYIAAFAVDFAVKP